MALIIKGDMPKACFWYDEEGHCIRCFNYGACPYEEIDCFPKRPPRCPIIGEIPDQHGDLIDIQAVEERAKAIQYEKGIPYNEALLVAFDTASVVVEASK